MLKRIEQALAGLAKRGGLYICAGLAIALIAGITVATPPPSPFGDIGGLSSCEWSALAAQWKDCEQDSKTLATILVTADVALPVCLCALFMMALATWPVGPKTRWLLIVPVIAATADLTENGLLYQFLPTEDFESPLVAMAQIATRVKFASYGLAFTAAFLGWRNRDTHSSTTQTESPAPKATQSNS